MDVIKKSVILPECNATLSFLSFSGDTVGIGEETMMVVKLVVRE